MAFPRHLYNWIGMRALLFFAIGHTLFPAQGLDCCRPNVFGARSSYSLLTVASCIAPYAIAPPGILSCKCFLPQQGISLTLYPTQNIHISKSRNSICFTLPYINCWNCSSLSSFFRSSPRQSSQIPFNKSPGSHRHPHLSHLRIYRFPHAVVSNNIHSS